MRLRFTDNPRRFVDDPSRFVGTDRFADRDVSAMAAIRLSNVRARATLDAETLAPGEIRSRADLRTRIKALDAVASDVSLPEWQRIRAINQAARLRYGQPEVQS
jgi:hypothetical protein